MQDTQDFIRVRHVPHPGIPARILDSVSESSQHKGNDEDWVWGMDRNYDISDDMRKRSKKCNTSLSKLEVYDIIEESAGCVPDQWRQEDEGDDDIGQVVVLFHVNKQSSVSGIVGAHDEHGEEAGKAPGNIDAGAVPLLQLLVGRVWRKLGLDWVVVLTASTRLFASAELALLAGAQGVVASAPRGSILNAQAVSSLRLLKLD